MTPSVRLFTARYSNPNVARSGLVPVGITRYPPRFRLAYELKANLYDLAPSANLFAKAKKGLPPEEFLQEYVSQLAQLGLQDILRQLSSMQRDGAGVVLLCYEDLTAGGTCHRTMLAEWLEREGELRVQELPDPGKKDPRKKMPPGR